MALAPVHRQGQLQPRAAGQQPAIQPHRAGTAAPPPQEADAERPLLHQLRQALPPPGQGVLAVVGGEIPGIPELPPIAVATPGQRPGQLGLAAVIPELFQPARPQPQAQQPVIEQPALLLPLQPHRLLQAGAAGGWRLAGNHRRERPPRQALGHHPLQTWQLHPAAPARGRLLGQLALLQLPLPRR